MLVRKSNININKALVRRAKLKAITFSILFSALTIIHGILFQWGNFFIYSLCFIYSYGIGYTWFGRKFHKFEEFELDEKSDTAIDGVNINNGYPSGSGYVLPKPLSHKDF